MPDTTQAQGSYGQHIAHADFYGTAAPLATNGLGTEVISYVVDEPDGVISLATDATDDDTALVGVQAVFTPAKNAPMAIEARYKMPSLTNQASWLGFCTQDANSSEVTDNNAIVGTVTDAAGISFDSVVSATQLTEFIATGSAITQHGLINDTVTADKYKVGRVEIDPDGTVRTYVASTYGDGSGYGTGALRLIAERKAAISTTALLFPQLYSAARTTAAATVECDYVHFTAGRYWVA